MKATVASVVLALCTLSAFGAPCALAQTATKLTQPQLEQLVAPIALYPDALLAQVLTSSTYPFEIFEAQRWAKQNSGLAGTALESALTQHDWDPSVKALCGFPSVLAQMNDNLDWTKDLGDAFLAEKASVLATVQSMRQKALQSGNLKTTEQQTVTQDDSMIVVTPASPDLIYVPTYSPLYVYGAEWRYPTYYYPALYRAPIAGYGALAFTTGVAWGAALYGSCDWHRGEVHVDVDRYNTFNRSTVYDANRVDRDRVNTYRTSANRRSAYDTNFQNAAGHQVAWQHDAFHRQSVNYGNSEVARQYGGAARVNDYDRNRARGYGDQVESRAYSNAAGAFGGSNNASFERYASQRGAASWGGGGRSGGGRRR
jgi:hypothetical protein